MADGKKPIDESLSRMSDALARADVAPLARTRGAGSGGPVMTILGMVLLVAALKTHNPLFSVLATGTLAVAVGFFLRRIGSTVLTSLQGGPPSSTHASIGLGATVAESAVIEPGASVEMGATIGRGAVVRSGAIVRMGATIERDAVVEKGAVVSWGVVVSRGAVVGERSVVGAGAVVRRGARVPPGMRLSPGAVFAAAQIAPPTIEAPAPPSVLPPRQAQRDPRDERLAAVCDKLEAELRASPEQVRAFLGGSDVTIASLRRTCEDLSRRERAMREEADPASVARLDEERAGLEKRIAAESDAQLRQSLQGAIAAVEELKRQRELLRVGAERLQAEHTRLLYTLEGLASQLVRLRTAGDTAAPADVSKSALDLRARIDAIADALEEVSREAPAAMRELATGPAGAGPDEPGAAATREPIR